MKKKSSPSVSDSPPRSERRSRVIIEKRFQSWFVLSLTTFVGAFLLMLSGGILLWFRLIVSQYEKISSILSPSFLNEIQDSERSGFLLIVAMNLVLIGVAVFHAFHFSGKIAGPLFAISRNLDAMLNTGNWKPVVLRKEDLFQELVTRLNSALAKTTISQTESSHDHEKAERAS